MIQIINDNCLNVIEDIFDAYKNRKIVLVSDPPFNIGYKYNSYKDNIKENEYLDMMNKLFSKYPSVIIAYPETLYKIAIKMGKAPNKVVSWVYNSNNPRQHRDIAFFDIMPDFNQVTQPYKNPNDKRIKELIRQGKTGSRLYDWWNVNQVKNVSKEKTEHPCQMPLEVMKNIIGILPKDTLVVDPFAGSGTTLVACKELGVDCIGIEIDENYCEIIKNRCKYE